MTSSMHDICQSWTFIENKIQYALLLYEYHSVLCKSKETKRHSLCA